MKNSNAILLISSLFLVTVNAAHANPQSGFGVEPGTTNIRMIPRRANSSSNFRGLYVNQDSSVTIFVPQFGNPTGSGSMGISPHSNLDGVCALYGLGSFVPNSMAYDDRHTPSVLVDRDGRYNQFSDGYAISNLACSPYLSTGVPENRNISAKTRNDDGTSTLVRPGYAMAGQIRHFSPQGYLDGVCQMYGLSQAIASSLTYSDYHQPSVLTGNAGQFTDYANGYGIDSLMCR